MSFKFERVSVSDVCELIVDCVNKTAPKVEYETQFKMIRTPNIRNGVINLDGCNYVSEETYKKWTRRATVEKDDILLTREAPMGEVGIIDFEDAVFLGQRIMQYRVNKSKLCPKFLLYSFLSSDLKNQFYQHEGSGSVVSHIRVPDCLKFEINLPSLKIQRKISSFLWGVDQKIKNNNKMNQTFEQMAQALFKSWFVDFEPVKAKIAVLEAGGSQEDATLAAMTAISGKDANALVVFEREHPEYYAELKTTAELFPSAMQEGALGATPTGWKLGCIGDISHRIRTKVGSTSAVVLSAIASGDLVPSDEHFTKQVYSKSIEKYILVEQWSFAYNPSRINIGSIGLNVRNVNGAVSPVYVVFKTEQEYKWYVEILTKTTYFKNNVNILASGSVRQSLSYDDLSSIPLCIPDVSIVNVFNEKYEGYLTFIEQYRNQNNTLISIRDTLLPKLLSGEITLPEAEQAVSEEENV
ncbi:TPA: restriction endonuclease subunit S [Enterobacter mori]|uniref:restriction endonuclease subunit S n=1 Tax=Enterobacter mori TaxID=539813 RepID=UPI0029472736|nr:restriction endonuclease subunit S [Enterobacter mori]MEB7566529.1 restriction endonuclease subunit S [Enterobacter mori]HED4181716.1 restriction endonuclease subunit S [Enterobacter mori]HED4185173.1 restriction endonuclease subunit S [Enterobacter mori]